MRQQVNTDRSSKLSEEAALFISYSELKSFFSLTNFKLR